VNAKLLPGSELWKGKNDLHLAMHSNKKEQEITGSNADNIGICVHCKLHSSLEAVRHITHIGSEVMQKLFQIQY
jgi:hypothetical protein